MPAAPTTFGAVRAALEGVEGWLTEAQAERLYQAATRIDDGGRIVEIGSFRGRSTIALAMGGANAGEVVAIDPHAGNDRGPREIDGFEAEAATDHEIFNANLVRAGVSGRVRHVRLLSGDAHAVVGEPIDVLFIDGAHRLGPASADLKEWGVRVPPAGTMLVHDAFSSVGVTLALLRTVVFSGQWRYVGRSGSLVEYRRGPASFGERLASIGRQLATMPWFAKNLFVKGLIVLRLRRGPWPY